MKPILSFGILLLSLTGCQVFTSSDDSPDYPDERLFGIWHKTETVDTQFPAPDKRVYGWKISSRNGENLKTMGSMQPIGREGITAEVSLINTKYVPDIHKLDSDKMIVDHYMHPEKRIDTVRYSISSDTLFLEGKYYQGKFRRIQPDTKIGEPLISRFEVEIDGRKIKNLEIDEITPTAYVTRMSSDEIRIKSNFSSEKITIKIKEYDGPGTYIIRKDQAIYTQFGTDWISPPYKTQSDSSGFITIENKDSKTNRYTGHFEFSAQRADASSDPENTIQFTEADFDLPVLE